MASGRPVPAAGGDGRLWDFSGPGVTVEGNERYTDEELKQLLVGDGYANTLFLLIKSKYEGLGNCRLSARRRLRPSPPAISGSRCMRNRLWDTCSIWGQICILIRTASWWRARRR